MMHSTPSRASARPAPVMTSTPLERAISTTSWPGGLEQLDDVAADPPGGSRDCDLAHLCSPSSHPLALPRQCIDGCRRENVTNDRERIPCRAVRGHAAAPAGRRLPHARLAQRGGRRRPRGVAAPQPLGRERDRQPGRVADHRGRARVARHAALAPVAPRGIARRRARARADREPRGRPRSRARGAAGRLGRPRAARRAREAQPGRAARLRAARHVRRAVRRDRPDGRPLTGRRPPARQPRPAAGARRGPRSRRRPRRAAPRGRRLLRRRPRRRLRRARRGARPGCRRALRRRPQRPDARGPRRGGRRRAGDELRPPRPVRPPGARERRGRRRRRAPRPAVRGHGLHGRRRAGSSRSTRWPIRSAWRGSI